MLADNPSALAVVTGEHWVTAMRFASLLLRGGYRVLLATEEFGAAGGEHWPRGTLIVPLSRRWDPWLTNPPSGDFVRAAVAATGVEFVALDDEVPLVAAPLAPVIVGLYGGGGAPFNQASVLAACGFPVRFVSDVEIRAGELATIDVLVMPGGGARAMHGQLEPLGESGCRAIAEWVQRGGMYIGCCAGAYDCIVNTGAFVDSCPAQRDLQLLNAGPWQGSGAVEFMALQSPGVGVVRVRNERPDHPVMFGMDAEFEIVHYNGPVLDPLPTRTVAAASAAVGLAVFNGATERFTPAEAFAGAPMERRPTYLDHASEADRYAIAAGDYGVGRVVAFGSHPEFGFDLPMIEWGAPARMLVNAVFWQATARRRRPAPTDDAMPGPISLPLGHALAEVERLAAKVFEPVRDLTARPITPPPRWLTPPYALSIFGLPPAEIWRQALADIVSLTHEVEAAAAILRGRVTALVSDVAAGPAPAIAAALWQIERWVLDERAAGWKQDGGFQGVLALLRTAATLCQRALTNWEIELGPPDGPYGYFDTNPYHLVAGSYLAAVGCVAGARQLLRALTAELEMAEWLAGTPVPVGAAGSTAGW